MRQNVVFGLLGHLPAEEFANDLANMQHFGLGEAIRLGHKVVKHDMTSLCIIITPKGASNLLGPGKISCWCH